MWKKAFIRFMLIIMIVIAGVLVVAKPHTPLTDSKSEALPDNTCKTKSQTDFVIWESVGRAVMAGTQ